MISLKITDVKNFMSKLLVGTVFDSLLVSEISLTTFNTFTINGHIVKDYFSSEELESMTESDCSSWETLKPICYELIKGNKTPLRFKITFHANRLSVVKNIEKSSAMLSPEQIGGLHIHFIYEDGKITAITGTTLNIFTMDKTLEQYWDNQILSFLSTHFTIEKE